LKTDEHHDDLAQIETRCRSKAEAAHWAAMGYASPGTGSFFRAEGEPPTPECADWAARLIDCLYWGSASIGSTNADLSLLAALADWFRVMAEGLSLVRAARESPNVLNQVLPMIAEAQSGLRTAIERVGATEDPDQLSVFEWLKSTAARHRVYIARFMRAEDRADPASWPDLLSRIEALRERHRPARGPSPRQSHVRRPGSHSSSEEPTREVTDAARLLGGRIAVLIGGSRRRDAQEALETALGLKELIWIETKEHQAVGTFESQIARPDVALVLLAIRWSSHAFGEVKAICERHGRPFVRLPGGYNPNQVAAQVLAQCSEQLSQS
jgi:hypothetical protein